MRPIKLEIEGLQSYEKKQIIDFEKLTEYGLFGIFGNTGSGKSTIIDAITYAIYGDIVRRDSSTRLDDLLNVNSEKLRVEFTFEIGTDRYLIERAVKCKRGSRELSASKRNIMMKNDDVLCDGHKEIGKEIGNIIGLTMDDFTRSVVLPQGKFSEFLKLSGAERRDMLERIFDLKEYGKRLLDKIRTEKKALEDKIKSIDDQIKGKGEDLTPEVLEAKKKEKKILEGELDTLNVKKKEIDSEFRELEVVKILSDDKKHLADEQEQLLSKKEEVSIDEIRVERAKQAAPINLEVETHKKLLKEVKEKEISLENLVKKVEIKSSEHREKKSKAEELRESSINIQKEIEITEVTPLENKKSRELSINLNGYSEAHGNRLKYKNEIVLKEKQTKEFIKIEKDDQDKKEALEKQLRSLEIISEVEIERLKHRLKDLDLDEIEKLEKEISTTETNLEKERTKSLNLEAVIGEKLENLRVLRGKEREEFASKLAKDLKDGDSCPVCGSNHHPNLAKHRDEGIVGIEEEIEKLEKDLEKDRQEQNKLKVDILGERLVDLREKLGENNSKKVSLEVSGIEDKIKELEDKRKEQLTREEELKKDMSIAEKDLNSSKEKIAVLNSETLSYKERLGEAIAKFDLTKLEIERIDGEFIVDDFVDIDRVQKFIDEIASRLEKEDSLKGELKSLESAKNKYLDEVTAIYEEIINYDKEKIKIQTDIVQEEKIINALWEKVETLMADNQFNSLDEVKSAILDKEKIEKLEEYITSYKKNLESNKVKLEEVEKKLGGRIYCEDKYRDNKKTIDEVSEKIETANKSIGSFEKEIEKIEREIEAVKDLLEDRAKFVEEHDRYDILSKICAGNKFVEYLSISKIKNISKIASRRLSKISNGRYALTVDLDGSFLIVDNFNGGERRKTATLSGGESFLVSLSLALALSSQIQLKGRIQLEFFFLDEGFGTLDSIVLDRVMTSLETLKIEEKMKVGIITHVEELKERIPRKILVHPAISGEKGSTVEMVGL